MAVQVFDPGRFLEIAVVAGVIGLQGGLKVRPFNADSDVFAKMTEVFLQRVAEPTAPVAFKIRQIERRKLAWVLYLGQIDTLELAQKWKGAKVLAEKVVMRELLGFEETDFFQNDLIGFAVELPDGREIGRIKGFLADQPLVVVERESAAEVYLPYGDPWIERVDLQNRVIVLKVIEGLLEL